MSIESINIENFKSIRETGEIKIHDLNVLIGPNGAGKSNFISFFKFLNKLFEQQLQNYVTKKGRADSFLYFGRKTSSFLGGKIIFRNDDGKISNRYRFKMEADQSNSLFFTEEYSDYNMRDQLSDFVSWSSKKINAGGTAESKLPDETSKRTEFLRVFFQSFKVFHFHDTSDSSKLKGFCNTTDYAYFMEEGSNLPAFLYKMQETAPKNFKLLEFTVKSIAPFIERLYLQPDEINPNQIELRWREIGHDNLFNAFSLSDGTLRFISLCTLLLQPDPPSTIIIDEPELGLHPLAMNKLSAMLKSASANAQIIISTQSTNLLDQFGADDVLVVEREDNQTVLKRLSENELRDWIDN
jgi:predicted ATPase